MRLPSIYASAWKTNGANPVNTTENTQPAGLQAPRAKMQAQNVRVFYGEHQAIKGINLDLMENEVIAFIGPSGCCKSTFLRSFNRLTETIDACRLECCITLDGED